MFAFVPLALGIWAIVGIATGSSVIVIGGVAYRVRSRQAARFTRAYQNGGLSAVHVVAMALSPRKGQKHYDAFLASDLLKRLVEAKKASLDAVAAAAAAA